MLYCCAAELEFLQGTPNAHNSLVYARDGVRLLRERLKDPVRAISDTTLGAVATLATLEVRTYSPSIEPIRTYSASITKVI